MTKGRLNVVDGRRMVTSATTVRADVPPGVVSATRAFGGSVRWWLHLEGAAALIAGIAVYGSRGGDWIWLVPLLLLPDLSMVGFAGGPRLGSLTYNLVHNWAIGIALLGAGVWLDSSLLVLAGSILIAHVGGDRLAGYGLKYPTAFKDTHLQRA